MDSSNRSAFGRLAILLLGLYLFIIPAHAAFENPYCSSQNTASDLKATYEKYQSNGWCTDHCKSSGTYAFAVINYQDCWCSNYIPSDQRDISECSTTCPGYKTENCGNQDENLYVYVKLPNEPSGTVGGSEPTSSANVSPSPAATSSSSTEAPPSSKATTTQTQDKPSSTTHAAPQTTTSEEQAPATSPPQTSVRIITESGAIITQTVVTTPTAAPIQQSRKSSSNTGAIVGGVVGGVAGVLALGGGIVFALWRRRRKQNQEEDPQSGVHRNTSTLSRSGLIGRTEKEPQYPPPIMTNMSRRPSRNLDNNSISPGSDRRNSRHLVDQRLNPDTIFHFDNASALSVGSVDDSRDYHRPLNVRNPDPEA